MKRSLPAVSLALTLAVGATAAQAADGPDLTLYRADGDALFTSGDAAVDQGYAVVHERRDLSFSKGLQELLVGNLPDYLDAEAVNLRFASDKVRVVSQRLLLSRGQNGTLTGQVGKQVTVIGNNGQVLVQGTLERVGEDGSLTIGGDVFGPTVVRQYAAVKLVGGQVGGGSRLQLRVDASGDGSSRATLTYPTSGLGWRAAYTATLQPGDACRMVLRAQASIANRSGRDWNGASVKLVAGAPRFASGGGPRPMAMAKRTFSAEAAPALPTQATLDAYRTFTLDGDVDLPDGSVTLTPLYDAKTLDCTRTWMFENGGTWMPPKPMTEPSFSNGGSGGSIASTLAFKAFDALPAGVLRVLTADRDDKMEFLGESRVDDTPKGREVDVTLGTAFDLRADRERTDFHVDQAARQMDESYRITLTNAGQAARTVTVREHPNRWRQWSVTASSVAPSRRTPDTLEFEVKVPAAGKATLEYTVRYTWTAADE